MTDSDSADSRSNRDSRTTISNGDYLLTRIPEGFPGKVVRGCYAYDHHVAWWLKTGTVVPEKHVVHHLNGNKKDNRFENLECLSSREHSRGHQKPAERKKVECEVCGKEFYRRVKLLAEKSRTNSAICCSKTCAGYIGKSVGRAEHGTIGAYGRCGPPTCELCREAMNKYRRTRRAVNTASR